jgi:hypothetical protein
LIVLTLSRRPATERLTVRDVRPAETVPVTKRTMFPMLAVALAALALGGCGGTADDHGSAAVVKPAAQQLADANPTPADTAAGPAAGPTTAAPTIEAGGASATTVRKTVIKTRSIAYPTRTVKDSGLAKGKTVTRTAGRMGVQTLTYEVTFTDGKQTAKKLIRSVVTRPPVTKVVAVGTRRSAGSGCDPNYSGACVPIASDVDCAGGSGNGPAYVTGPVRVVGNDIYQLDRDGDGVACDD